jgi:serine/threonine-protein kinase
MGDVYLAKDPNIGRQLAIKTVRNLAGSEREVRERQQRLLREARAAGRLLHPNIVTLFDADEADGILFLAFEYVAGADLAARLAEGLPLSLGQVLAMVREIASALDCAHREGIVHRDIKPSNILLGSAGEAKVADFGIAKLLDQSTHLTQTGSVIGSPQYMSPEQIRGESLDGRSDIFSLGVLFYELLTRTRPFDGESISTLVFQILSEDPPSVGVLRPDLPPRLVNLVDRMMAKEAAKRVPTAAHVVAEVEALEGDLPTGTLVAAVLPSGIQTQVQRGTTAQPTPPLPTSWGGQSEEKKGPFNGWRRLSLWMGLAVFVGFIALGLTIWRASRGAPKGLQQRVEESTVESSSVAPEERPASPAEERAESKGEKDTLLPMATPSEAEPEDGALPFLELAQSAARGERGDVARESVQDQKPAIVEEGSTRPPVHSSPPPPPPLRLPPPQAAPAQAASTEAVPVQANTDRLGNSATIDFDRRARSVQHHIESGRSLRFDYKGKDAFIRVWRRQDEKSFMGGRISEFRVGGKGTDLELPFAGEYLITLVPIGGGGKERTFRVSASDSQSGLPKVIRAALFEPPTGPLGTAKVLPTGKGIFFMGSPANADVFIDGNRRGNASEWPGPGRFLALQPGTHQLRLSAPGFETATFTLRVRRFGPRRGIEYQLKQQ